MIRSRPWLFTLAAALLTAIVLYAMGRNLICPCGEIRLWGGNAPSDQSSQHLLDWYTPSHFLHGFLFFGILWLIARRLSFGARLVIATVVECVWEVIENTPWVIERYRAVTVSLDYNGDSVVNSVVDILAMLAGFYLARRAPVWLSVGIVLGFEILTMIIIRDGLALNILMLLWPVDAVRDWQSGL